MAPRVWRGGEWPVRGFGVEQVVFDRDRLLRFRNCQGSLFAGGGDLGGEEMDGDPADGTETVHLENLQIGEGRIGRGGSELLHFGVSRFEIVAADEGEAAGVMTGHLHELHGHAGVGLGEDFVPFGEADHGEQRRGLEHVAQAEAGLLEILVGVLGSDFAGGVKRVLGTSFHGERREEEMDVVGIVSGGVDALSTALGDVVLVGGNGLHIGVNGVGVAAHADVDMRGHVDKVAGLRRKTTQPVGGGQSEFRMRPGLDRDRSSAS